ncbi:FG-GAP repeat domain-containing protein [Agromyces sp. SYSU T00194]|uniref:FG-GAP repeat domain-containing protein n=1 Tax=Agromyces chitinivorans TaxID=3158560 RepID=UPI003391DF3D
MYRTTASAIFIAGLLATIAVAPAQAAPGGNGNGNGNAGSGGNGNAGSGGNGNGNAGSGGNGNALGKDPAPAVAAPDTEPVFALPSWGDGLWGSSENYETIQSGDLDGDGDGELIGRSVRGVEAWNFDQAAGQWTPIVTSNSLDWSDSEGWDQKQYYETIGTADVDGDGVDEIYTRTYAGVQAVRLLPAGSLTDASWQDLPLLDEFTTPQGWDLPQYYTTIQAADLDGDGDDEIFGRGAGAVVIADFAGGSWHISSLGHFTDSGGWGAAEYYSTIQAADLDGDGRAEILGRGHDGMTVYGFEGGAWVHLSSSGPFTNADHWDDAKYYRTIQTADLDGDRQAELIGRDAGGLHVYAFGDQDGAAGSGAWITLPTAFDFNDNFGWGDASNYLTIQGADVDGDGRDEVIGRTSTTMAVYGLSPSSYTWSNEQQVAGPGFTNALGWNHARHYDTIQVVDVDGVTLNGQPGSANASRADLIGRGPNGIQTYRFDAKAGSWTSPTATFPTWTGTAQTVYEIISHALDVTTDDIRTVYDTDAGALGDWATDAAKLEPPVGIPVSTWQQVQDQVVQELKWAKNVAEATANRTDLITEVTALKGSDTTASYLDYDTSTSNDSQLAANLLVLLAGFADAASNLGAPGLQVALGSLDAAASFGASEGQNASASFEGTYLELKSAIEGWWGTAETANEAAKAAVVADYGLLSTVGELYGNGTWPQFGKGDPGWAAAVDANARGYSIWVWQTVTPSLPQPCEFLAICAGWIVGECTVDYCLHHEDGYDYTLRVSTCQLPSNCPNYDKDSFSQHVTVGHKLIENSLLKQLVDPVSDGCLSSWRPEECHFGVSSLDVIVGLDGWPYSCSAWSNAGDHFLPAKFCSNLETVRERYGSRE